MGLLLALRVTDAHGGGPALTVGVGMTGCQAPAPPLAVPLNQSRPFPPAKLQSVTVREVNELPDDTATSKYSPDETNEGAPTGSDPY